MERRFGFRAGPFPAEEVRLFISRTNPTIGTSGGSALGLEGQRTAKALNGSRAQRPCGGWLPGSHQVHLGGARPGRGSRGCWTAINHHIHGVLTRRDCGGWSGGTSWARSSQTFLECGRVVVTAVAAMGGLGRATGGDWLLVSAPGAGGILTSVRRASMVKRTNGARRVGCGASLMGVSVSPTFSTLGGSVG